MLTSGVLRGVIFVRLKWIAICVRGKTLSIAVSHVRKRLLNYMRRNRTWVQCEKLYDWKMCWL